MLSILAFPQARVDVLSYCLQQAVLYSIGAFSCIRLGWIFFPQTSLAANTLQAIYAKPSFDNAG